MNKESAVIFSACSIVYLFDAYFVALLYPHRHSAVVLLLYLSLYTMIIGHEKDKH